VAGAEEATASGGVDLGTRRLIGQNFAGGMTDYVFEVKDREESELYTLDSAPNEDKAVRLPIVFSSRVISSRFFQ
jgi:hypothetical protein